MKLSESSISFTYLGIIVIKFEGRMTKNEVLDETLRLWNQGRYDAATKYYRKYGISDALFSKCLVNSMVRTN